MLAANGALCATHTAPFSFPLPRPLLLSQTLPARSAPFKPLPQLPALVLPPTDQPLRAPASHAILSTRQRCAVLNISAPSPTPPSPYLHVFSFPPSPLPGWQPLSRRAEAWVAATGERCGCTWGAAREAQARLASHPPHRQAPLLLVLLRRRPRPPSPPSHDLSSSLTLRGAGTDWR